MRPVDGIRRTALDALRGGVAYNAVGWWRMGADEGWSAPEHDRGSADADDDWRSAQPPEDGSATGEGRWWSEPDAERGNAAADEDWRRVYPADSVRRCCCCCRAPPADEGLNSAAT